MYIEIIQLEKQKEEYEAEILLKEKRLLQLREELETAEMEYNKLENSSFKKMLLGLVGKKEEHLQKAMNESRRVQAEITNEEFFVSSSQNQIQQIVERLQELEEQLPEDESQMEAFYRVHQIPKLRRKIAVLILELKEHFEFAEIIHKYGDLHTDVSGKRYDRKDKTMRECAGRIKLATQSLKELLVRYNEIVPEEIVIEFREEWMDDESYWEEQQLEEDSYRRIKKVDDWFFRFNTVWKKIDRQQNEVVENLRNEVLDKMRTEEKGV